MGAINIFGTKNDREVKKYNKIISKINNFEKVLKNLSDIELQAKTQEFRNRLKKGENDHLILPEAFAVVREASCRVLSMRHYDVQLIGGLVMNEGKIAEMRTGEGKTLVATLPCYFNALKGSVHVVTVNDYLAKRDCELMEPLFRFLGLKAAPLQDDMSSFLRQQAYQCDVIYATSSQFGFDYLRDHMAMDKNEILQTSHDFALVDELDSVLIDEARTPLVISGHGEADPESYSIVKELAEQFQISDHMINERLKKNGKEDEVERKDAEIDFKHKNVDIAEAGFAKAEKYFLEMAIIRSHKEMYKASGLYWLHVLKIMLSGLHLYKRDIDYIVDDGEVKIIDENTGRVMDGRRWGEGTHQALEAIEGLEVQPENMNLASISIQNYFRIYDKLSGMTGTADTEALELKNTYSLDVIVIPTNQKIMRNDESDQVYMSFASKMKFVLKDIVDSNKRGQPVLVGTTNIEMSEFISKHLEKQGIIHNVLNAKNHANEAMTIAQAGRPRAITIATNMAGRGTDIILGGNPDIFIAQLTEPSELEIEAVRAKCKADQKEVLQAGGLRVIGTERHNSRRIDNQLIGRAGRQGDPGSSRFYLSVDDDLLKRFISEKHRVLIQRLGMSEDEGIEGRMISNVIAKSQATIENYHYEIRKDMLKFDDTVDEQRSVIYAQREQLLEAEDFIDVIHQKLEELVDHVCLNRVDPDTPQEFWMLDELKAYFKEEMDLETDFDSWFKDGDAKMTGYEFKERLLQHLKGVANHYAEIFGLEYMSSLARQVYLHILDQNWREHIELLAALQDGIHLRGYAQKDPKQEYKREAYDLYKSMVMNINELFIRSFFISAKEMIQVELQRMHADEQLVDFNAENLEVVEAEFEETA